MTGTDNEDDRPVSKAPMPESPVTVSAAKTTIGLPEVLGEPGYDALVGFLESDLQGGIAGVEQLLADVQRIERGETDIVERCGNAYRLQLQRDVAVLQSLHDPQQADCRVDMPLLHRTLMAWRAALRQA